MVSGSSPGFPNSWPDVKVFPKVWHVKEAACPRQFPQGVYVSISYYYCHYHYYYYYYVLMLILLCLYLTYLCKCEMNVELPTFGMYSWIHREL